MKNLLGRVLSERNLFLIIGLLLVLVCTTGYWVYDSLQKVADEPLPTANRESRRFLIQDLNNNLLKADNLTYTFLYQGNNESMAEFQDLKSITYRRLKQLKIHRKQDRVFQFQLQKLDKLIHKRFTNLEILMSIQNENRVDETMQLVVSEVESASRLKLPKYKQPTVTQPTTPQEKERRRIFKKKQPKQEPTVTVVAPTINPELLADQRTREINRKLQSVGEEVISKEDDQNSLRLDLEQSNNLLTKQIGHILRAIEVADKKELLNETRRAKEVAGQTNQVIVLFCVVSCILIAAIFIFMINLFSRSRAANLQLKRAKDKSDELTEAKSRFIATVSHEIRTPLNAIAGFSDQLHFHNLPKEAAEKVEIIRNSAKHLSQITNEVLDFSKLEKDYVLLEAIPFNLNKELHLVQEQFGFQLQEKKNNLVLDASEDLPDVIGDPLRFRQVLINLISNANKFSESSTVTLRCSVRKKEANKVMCLLEVIDEGIGLTQEQQVRIFEPFEQGDTSVSRKFGGTGLGLSITKQIIDKQGGTVAVNSRFGKGTTFMIEIPFELASGEQMEVITDEPIDFKFLEGRTILVADDEPFNRLLLKSMFQSVSLNLLEAENGIQALEILRNNHVDAVLLDVRMPEMDGDELMKELRLDNILAAIPVVGLTATLDFQRRSTMLADGWTEVLTKPVQPAVLQEVLLQIIETQIYEPMDNPNFEGIRRLANDNMAFYKELLRTFVNSTENGMNSLHQNIEEENWKQVGELAHQLAAPFKHFNATTCYNLLKRIEKMGKESEEGVEITAAVAEFGEEANSILNLVKDELKNYE